MDGRTVRVVAFAKVNLCLEVLGKRNDGFHEVRSIMQSIDVADELTIEEASDLTVSCDLPELAGEENLAMRAATALLERYSHDGGARITIRKGIPVASGMGGASADAAAALVGLVNLWGMKVQPSDLQIVAADLGSDVPFFLTGGTTIVKGRGHIVYPLSTTPLLWLVLVVPPHSVERKTAALYRRLTPEDWSGGERVDRLAEAITEGRGVSPVLVSNVFERVAVSVFPALIGYREAMLAAG